MELMKVLSYEVSTVVERNQITLEVTSITKSLSIEFALKSYSTDDIFCVEVSGVVLNFAPAVSHLAKGGGYILKKASCFDFKGVDLEKLIGAKVWKKK